MDLQTRQRFIGLSLRRVKPGSGSAQEFLRARTWSRAVANLRDLMDIPYVIVGGVATRMYMPERMTDDLDVLIHSSEAELCYGQLLARGATRIGDLSIGGTSWRLPDNTVLDIIVSDRAWVREAINSPNVGPDGQPVVGLPYLVLMKLAASRTTDLSDISRMLGQADDRELEGVRQAIVSYDPGSLEDLESLIQLGKLEMS